jgi:hypothetical protein
VSYLAAYCFNLYQDDALLKKKEQNAWRDLEWSLKTGNEYTRDNPDKEENPDKEDNPDEDAEETESDREEDPAPDTTPRPEATPRKSERLAEEKKRPAEEKKKPAEEKRPQHSARFVPKVGGADIPKDYKASGTAEQSIWWATKIASKIDKIEAQLKEAAAPLFCKPKNLVPAIKEKIKICNRVEDLEIQKEKDLKRIEELLKANTRLRNEKGLRNLQLENEKKNQAWKEKALSELEEANLRS